MPLRILSLVLLIVVAAICIPLTGAAAEPVSFKPAWHEHETARYQVIKSRTQNGETHSANMTVAVTVVGKSDDGYVFEWRYEDFVADIPLPAAYSSMFTDLMQELRIKYATNQDGVYQRVVNEEELRQRITDLIPRLLALVPDAPARAMVGKYLTSLTSNENFVDYIAAKEIIYLHNPYFLGQDLEADEDYQLNITLPNPLDPARPLDGVVTMRASQSGGFKHIQIHQAVDKERSAAILMETLQDMAAAMGRQPAADFSVRDFAMTDSLQYTYKEAGGWPEQGSVARVIMVNGSTREEKIEFTRKE